MKLLVLAAVLMSFPWIGYAKGWQHSSYERELIGFSFWQEVNNRQYNLQKRIIRGVDSGQLTRSETKRLYREQKKVNKLIRQYKRFKYLSFGKKRKVMERLNIVSEKIRHYKHNVRYVHKRNRDDRYDTKFKAKNRFHKHWNQRNNDYDQRMSLNGYNRADIYFKF